LPIRQQPICSSWSPLPDRRWRNCSAPIRRRRNASSGLKSSSGNS